MFLGFHSLPLSCVWARPRQLVQRLRFLLPEDDVVSWQFDRGPLDLKAIYFPAPPRGGSHPARIAIWQPSNAPTGCAFLPNYEDGLIQLLRHLNRRFQIQYFNAFLAGDHVRDGYCAFEFANASGDHRVVQVIRDKRWQYHSEGPVQPFEVKSNYRRKRIAERLTPETVVDYLGVLGWDLEDDRFWRSMQEAWIITENPKRP